MRAVREAWKAEELLGVLADDHLMLDGRCAIVREPVGDQEGRDPVRVATGLVLRRANTNERWAVWWQGPHPGRFVVTNEVEEERP